MSGAGRTARLVLLLAALGAICPPAAPGQDEGRRGLSKSELVRLIVGRTYGPSEIAAIVLRNCLTFRPSARDRSDFRDLGAAPEVMDAMEECVRSSEPLLLALEPRRLSSVAGDTVAVVAVARRGGEPAAGVRVVVRRADGGVVSASATEASGRVRLRVPAGTTPGAYTLALEAPAESTLNRPTLSLRVTPGPPARVELDPPRLALAEAGTPRSVRVTVRDRHGNPLPGVPVTMLGARTPSGGAVATTDSSGVATLVASARALTLALPRPAAEGEQMEGRTVELDVLVAGAPMTALPVEVAAAPAPPARPAPVAAREEPAGEGPGQALAAAADSARYAAEPVDETPAAEGPPEAGPDTSGRPSAPAALVEAVVWGGGIFEGGGATGNGAVEVVVHPLGGLRLRGLFDEGVGLHTPLLVRGGDSFRTLLGGVEVDWGPERRLTSRFEIGRREQSDELFQNLYRLEQAVRFRVGAGSAVWRAGGFFGRWFDRDDWVAYTAVDVPLTRGTGVTAELSTGETVGTNVGDQGRRADRDSRFSLGAWFGGSIVEVQPLLGLGRVESDDEAFDGTLVEARLRFSIRIASVSRFQVLLRHQRPPGDPSFTNVAAGFAFRVDRRP